jgi:hypothetical protein
VSARTLKTWLTQPDFLAAYRAARRQIVEAAVTRLQQVCLQAVLALHRNLSCGKPTAEIAAARAILEQAIQGVDLYDLAGRVEALERQEAQRKEWGRPTC